MKAEVYRVAERHGIKVFVVSNSFMAVPREPLIERVIVASGPDAADDWIAERAARGAIVITSDVPLAHRCIKAGAEVIAPAGRVLTEASIGMALATRNLHGGSALGRADHRRPEAVPAARPLQFPVHARSRHRPAEAGRFRRLTINGAMHQLIGAPHYTVQPPLAWLGPPPPHSLFLKANKSCTLRRDHGVIGPLNPRRDAQFSTRSGIRDTHMSGTSPTTAAAEMGNRRPRIGRDRWDRRTVA